MPKVIHLSDLHVGYADCTARLDCLIGNLLFAMRPADEYVIVITGDLVEDANVPGVYDQVRARIDRLREAGFRVLVLPGNHDYGTGDFGSARFVPLFKQTFFGSTLVTYPTLDVIDDIAFIALDSMAEELSWHNRLFANGQLGEAQLARLDAVLADTAVEACAHRVVCLHHHPFDPVLLHELKDSAALGEVLAAHGNVDALLYGHNHAGWKRHGKWGIGRCYDGGSATRKDGKPGYHRVIDLAGDYRLDYDGDFFCNRDVETK